MKIINYFRCIWYKIWVPDDLDETKREAKMGKIGIFNPKYLPKMAQKWP